jgi:DNA-binding beta-propeller fold protein YncE
MTQSSTTTRRLALAALCAALAAFALLAPSARADPADPLFTYYASEEKEGPAHKPYPSPGGFEGPCGLAVDSLGDFYVADYYRSNVDALSSSRALLAQLTGEDPLDGPCGLAVGTGGDGALYVNNYHRNVVKFTPSAFPLSPPPFTPYGVGTVIDSEHPTGVAVNPLTGNVYVDDRTYVAVYEPSGAPVMDGGEPLRIGLGGSLEDGYGVAVSGSSATAGYVYVADATDNTVKVYDPALDTEEPVETIDGHETPAGHFVSLRDAALAVDNSSNSFAAGYIYVADDLQPEYVERPEAAIYAFQPSGAYAGRLKYNIVDARPPGLAVGAGRVYVTSGNTEGASVYAYSTGSLTPSVFPDPGAAALSPGGAGAGTVSASIVSASATTAASATGPGTPAVAPSPLVRRNRHAGRGHRARHHRSKQRHRHHRSAQGRRR